jgi:hypothetical protein
VDDTITNYAPSAVTAAIITAAVFASVASIAAAAAPAAVTATIIMAAVVASVAAAAAACFAIITAAVVGTPRARLGRQAPDAGLAQPLPAQVTLGYGTVSHSTSTSIMSSLFRSPMGYISCTVLPGLTAAKKP